MKCCSIWSNRVRLVAAKWGQIMTDCYEFSVVLSHHQNWLKRNFKREKKKISEFNLSTCHFPVTIKKRERAVEDLSKLNWILNHLSLPFFSTLSSLFLTNFCTNNGCACCVDKKPCISVLLNAFSGGELLVFNSCRNGTVTIPDQKYQNKYYPLYNQLVHT